MANGLANQNGILMDYSGEFHSKKVIPDGLTRPELATQKQSPIGLGQKDG